MAACLAGVISLLANWLPAADAVNHIAPFWIVGGSLSAAIGIVLPHDPPARRIAYLSLFFLLALGATLLLPEIVTDRPAPVADHPAFRLVQLNSWKDSPDPALTARWLRRQNADVLVLEETFQSISIPRLLYAGYPYAQSCTTGSRCSTVILARSPPIDAAGLAHGDAENRAALSAAWVRLRGMCGPITVVGVHLPRPWPWNSNSRLTELLADLRGMDRRRLVLAGDFNLTPWSGALRSFDANSGLRRLTHATPTWPSPLGYHGLGFPALFPIDQIYVGAAFRAIRVVRGPQVSSDHYPVVADLVDLDCVTRSRRRP